jgi:hypothetical protein
MKALYSVTVTSSNPPSKPFLGEPFVPGDDRVAVRQDRLLVERLLALVGALPQHQLELLALRGALGLGGLGGRVDHPQPPAGGRLAPRPRRLLSVLSPRSVTLTWWLE